MDRYYLNSAKVKKLIERSAKSYQEISERMGANSSYVSNALRDGTISEKFLVRLAQELKVDPETLVDYDRKETVHQYNTDHSEIVEYDTDLLYTLIKEHHYNQYAVSEMIGREKSYLSHAKKNGTIRLNALQEIADLLGVDVNTLLLNPAEPAEPEEPDEPVQLTFDDVPFLPVTVYGQDGRQVMAFSQCAKADIRQAMNRYIDTVLDALDELEEVINSALKEAES